MNYIGYILLFAGFLVGALVSVIDSTKVQWLYYIIAFIIAVIGITLVRIASKKAAQHEDTVSENIMNVENSLKRIVANIEKLDKEKEDIYTYDVHKHVDELFTHDLGEFVDSRKSIIHSFGLSDYAEIMTNFAAGERYLNRVWSASVDGYIDEVNQYISKSKEQFIKALSVFDNLIESKK